MSTQGKGLNMTMLEDYLAAVAAQLPEDQREDIIAELRDDILTRAEMHEEERGAPLGEDEFEALLREVGHPLVVAGRYGDGPKGIVGAELYPWWLFTVKAGLVVVLCVSILSMLVTVLFGQRDLGDAIGQAVRSMTTSGLMLVGGLTIAGWIIERQAKRPKFLTEWKVKDLAIFHSVSVLDQEKIKAWFQTGGAPVRKAEASAKASLVPGALASAIGTFVVLLWWLGVFGWKMVTPDGLDNGQTFFKAFFDIRDIIFVPVVFYILARIAFDVVRVVTGSPVRFTAAGDLAFGLVNAAFLAWLWLASPLAPLVEVHSWQDYLQLVSTGWRTETLRAVLTVSITMGLVFELVGLFKSGARLVTGRDLWRS